MKKTIEFLVVLFALHGALPAVAADPPKFKASWAEQDVVIDGVLDEPVWKIAGPISAFLQNGPKQGEPVSLKTTVQVAYGRDMICFAFTCEDPDPASISAGAGRDGAIGNDDSVVVLLDALNDGKNAYMFAFNTAGTQFDLVLLDNGGEWNIGWNGEWRSSCRKGDRGWTAEIGIPFDTIAFDRTKSEMGFNAIRNIPRNHEDAFLVLSRPNPWNVSGFGTITNLDLSGVVSVKSAENRQTLREMIQKAAGPTPENGGFDLMPDLFYKRGGDLDRYEKERCFLDLYLPKNAKNCPVIVWFHGGSLERGGKDDRATRKLAAHFAGRGVAVAVVNYRLSPAAKYPAYLEDAAASVGWVLEHIADYGGDPSALFIAGHSAGGYLTYMLGMDRKLLGAAGVEISRIAGLIPVAGQTFTHYTIRGERGIPDPENTPVIDEASPCYHSPRSGPPILAICGADDSGDRNEENRYLLALLKKKGYGNVEYREMKNRSHWDLIGNINEAGDPVSEAVLEFVSRHSLGPGRPMK